MMTTTRVDELTPAARTEITEFVAARYPGFPAPAGDTRVRITDKRVEFRIVRERAATIDTTIAHMQITDAIAESILDSLTRA